MWVIGINERETLMMGLDDIVDWLESLGAWIEVAHYREGPMVRASRGFRQLRFHPGGEHPSWWGWHGKGLAQVWGENEIFWQAVEWLAEKSPVDLNESIEREIVEK